MSAQASGTVLDVLGTAILGRLGKRSPISCGCSTFCLTMSEFQLIESALKQTARRRRRERALRGLWSGLLIGAIFWLLALAAYKLFPIPVASLSIAGGVALASALTGFFIGGLSELSLNANPPWIVERQKL